MAMIPANSAAPSSSSASSSSTTGVGVSIPSAPHEFGFSIGDLHRGGSQLALLCADLSAMGACVFCMMRYVNIKQEKAYHQSKEWLHAYLRIKLGWNVRFSSSHCTLCLDTLGSIDHYWHQAVLPAIQNTETGEWKYDIEAFTLNISEPILARIRQYAANQLLKSRYSRLQSGYVDVKDVLRWQLSNRIITGTGGKARFVAAHCDFGFLCTFTADIPDEEYGMIVATLPRAQQLLAVRAPGDFSMPASNNPARAEEKNDKDGHFKKRFKKHPVQDAMGQKTVLEALPRVKPEEWKKLAIFQPVFALDAERAKQAETQPAAAPNSGNSESSTSVQPSIATAATPTLAAPSTFVPPPIVATAFVAEPVLSLTAHREPILISGHYRKLYRCLSQSIWKLSEVKTVGAGAEKAKVDSSSTKEGSDEKQSATGSSGDVDASNDFSDSDGDEEEGGDEDEEEERRMTDSSVEEEIVRTLLSHFQAREYKFHSSGREDMDVRMLGNGRQFFIEFIEAKIAPKGDVWSDLQRVINENSEYVEVLQLHLSNKAEFNAMKRSIHSKHKTYRCVVWVASKLSGADDPRLLHLNSLHDLQLQQRTPIRVLHRRSLLTRPKMIFSIHTEYVNPHFFYLDVETSSGTYVKEFVHGDRGRTVPNVASLMQCHAEILQLDVIGFDTNKKGDSASAKQAPQSKK